MSNKQLQAKLKKDSRSWDTLDSQFKKHDVKNDGNTYSAHFTKSGQLVDTSNLNQHDLAAMMPDSKVLGLNELGRPTALFVYGNDRTTEREFEVDLDLQQTQRADGESVIECVGMQLLCPKCGSPMYIKGAGLDGGHEIFIHWDKMTRSNVDRKWRPLVSVDGTFGCDYSDAEIVGVRASKASHVVMRCNWRGGVMEGRCFDHSPTVLTGDT